MLLRFVGTRGEIGIRSGRHRRHTATTVESGRRRVLIDAGLDWSGLVDRLKPDAIVITHAHPDHAVPDVAALPHASRALEDVCLYVGDGAAISRPILRSRQGVLIGHASIGMQLDWCRDHGVRRAVFTHCGSDIVRSNHREACLRIARLGDARGVEATLASDGDILRVSGRESALRP